MNKVLFVLPTDTLGGAEQILKMIACNLSDAVVDIQFLTQKKTTHWDDLPDNINVSYITASTPYIGIYLYLINLIFGKKKKYTHIYTSHVFVTSMVGVFIKLGVLEKKYFVGRESTQIFTRFKGWRLRFYQTMYKIGYSKTDLIICQTQQMKDSFEQNQPNLARLKKVVFIQNPIKKPEFVEANEKINKYTPFIVTAGRLIHEKGFDILISVFQKINKKYPDLKLIILGEGSQRESLEGLIAKLQLKDQIILKGFVTNVNTYFKEATLCVVSSRIEGFPNVLLQMMSQNNVVVSTKCAGGIDEIKGVILAETDDLDSLETAILQGLENKTDNRADFDAFLNENSIEKYIDTINQYLKVLSI